MIEEKRLEKVIELLAILKERVEVMTCAYKKLPSIIEREHQGLLNGDISILEGTMHAKHSLSSEIEATFELVLKDVKSLEVYLDCKPSFGSLSAIAENIAAFAGALPKDTFQADVVRHIADGLGRSIAAFIDYAAMTKPKIEQNRYLVQKVLDNTHASIRFWQDLIGEAAASYDTKGKQQLQAGGSTFRVKA